MEKKIQKFEEETGIFSNRDDILVLVDEAHRSHYGLEATVKLNLERYLMLSSDEISAASAPSSIIFF